MYKPPAAETTSAPSREGNVGWHQDLQYWQTWWSGEAFTVWLALADVALDMGPVRFVRGSHRWGLREGGNFFSGELDAVRASVAAEGEPWEELPAVLTAGAVSMHHNLTVHGSGPNRSARPRRGMALHMRSERSAPAAGADHHYVTGAANLELSPIVYARATT